MTQCAAVVDNIGFAVPHTMTAQLLGYCALTFNGKE